MISYNRSIDTFGFTSNQIIPSPVLIIQLPHPTLYLRNIVAKGSATESETEIYEENWRKGVAKTIREKFHSIVSLSGYFLKLKREMLKKKIYNDSRQFIHENSPRRMLFAIAFWKKHNSGKWIYYYVSIINIPVHYFCFDGNHIRWIQISRIHLVTDYQDAIICLGNNDSFRAVISSIDIRPFDIPSGIQFH